MYKINQENLIKKVYELIKTIQKNLSESNDSQVRVYVVGGRAARPLSLEVTALEKITLTPSKYSPSRGLSLSLSTLSFTALNVISLQLKLP